MVTAGGREPDRDDWRQRGRYLGVRPTRPAASQAVCRHPRLLHRQPPHPGRASQAGIFTRRLPAIHSSCQLAGVLAETEK